MFALIFHALNCRRDLEMMRKQKEDEIMREKNLLTHEREELKYLDKELEELGEKFNNLF